MFTRGINPPRGVNESCMLLTAPQDVTLIVKAANKADLPGCLIALLFLQLVACGLNEAHRFSLQLVFRSHSALITVSVPIPKGKYISNMVEKIANFRRFSYARLCSQKSETHAEGQDRDLSNDFHHIRKVAWGSQTGATNSGRSIPPPLVPRCLIATIAATEPPQTMVSPDSPSSDMYSAAPF